MRVVFEHIWGLWKDLKISKMLRPHNFGETGTRDKKLIQFNSSDHECYEDNKLEEKIIHDPSGALPFVITGWCGSLSSSFVVPKNY
jgi:hypothetical protein